MDAVVDRRQFEPQLEAPSLKSLPSVTYAFEFVFVLCYYYGTSGTHQQNGGEYTRENSCGHWIKTSESPEPFFPVAAMGFLGVGLVSVHKKPRVLRLGFWD